MSTLDVMLPNRKAHFSFSGVPISCHVVLMSQALDIMWQVRAVYIKVTSRTFGMNMT